MDTIKKQMIRREEEKRLRKRGVAFGHFFNCVQRASTMELCSSAIMQAKLFYHPGNLLILEILFRQFRLPQAFKICLKDAILPLTTLPLTIYHSIFSEGSMGDRGKSVGDRQKGISVSRRGF